MQVNGLGTGRSPTGRISMGRSPAGRASVWAFLIWAWARARNTTFQAVCFHFGQEGKGYRIGLWTFFRVCSKRRGAGRMTRSNDEPVMWDDVV
jgi:hypothetical protein